ncbi:hypothetical protein J6590_024381 [Homalodisca vitripennis]|nr:hypothetical protein J6590_024381 [Homalodisca vitripennis]
MGSDHLITSKSNVIKLPLWHVGQDVNLYETRGRGNYRTVDTERTYFTNIGPQRQDNDVGSSSASSLSVLSDKIAAGDRDCVMGQSREISARVIDPRDEILLKQLTIGGNRCKIFRNLDMEVFLDMRRQKRNFRPRDLGYMGGESTPVYVNESLKKA